MEVKDMNSGNGNEKLVKEAIMKYGAVVTGLQVDKEFMKWGEGMTDKNQDAIYQPPGPQDASLGSHAIVLFGWGTNTKGSFWYAKNSHGNLWPRYTQEVKDLRLKPSIFRLARGGTMENSDVVIPIVESLAGEENAQCPDPLADAVPSELAGCLTVTNNPGPDAARPALSPDQIGCEVTHKCTQGDTLFGLEFKLDWKASETICGLIPGGGYSSVRPGQTFRREGALECCLTGVRKADVPVWTKEIKTGEDALKGGRCLTIDEDNNCAIKNECDDPIGVWVCPGDKIDTDCTKYSFGPGDRFVLPKYECGGNQKLYSRNQLFECLTVTKTDTGFEVTHTCTKHDTLKQLKYQLGDKGNACESWRYKASIFPGETKKYESTNELELCKASVQPRENSAVYTKEPGHCISASINGAGQCIFKNICSPLTIKVYKFPAETPKFDRYSTLGTAEDKDSAWFGPDYDGLCPNKESDKAMFSETISMAA